MSKSPTTEKLRAQFHRTNLSEEDFIEAEKYLECFKQKPIDDDIIKRALLLAAIVSYARPFLQSDRGSQSQATSKLSIKISQTLSVEEQAFHEKIMLLRNEALAHSQYTRKPVKWSGGFVNGFSYQASSFDLLSENIDIEQQFLPLCRKLKMYCMRMQGELSEKIRISDVS